MTLQRVPRVAPVLLVALWCSLPGPVGGPLVASEARQVPSARDKVAEGMRLARARQVEEAERVLAAAAERAQAEGDAIARANALWGLGSLRAAAGDHDARRRYDAEAAGAFEAAGDLAALGTFLNSRAIEAQARADSAEAEACWNRALDAYERAGDRVAQARVLRNLTFLSRLDLTERLGLLERALGLVRPGDSPALEGAIRHQLGDVLFMQGDLAGAARELDVAVPLLDAPVTRADHGRALVSLARLHRVQGDATGALAVGERAANALTSAGDHVGAAHALVAAAIAAFELGRPDDGLALGERAVTATRAGGRPVSLAGTLGQYALMLADVRRYRDAHAALDEADRIAVDDAGRAILLVNRASVLLAENRPEDALPLIDRAIAARAPLSADFRFQQHALRSRALDRLGRVEEALASSGHALGIVESVRRQLVPDDFAKRGFAERVRGEFALRIRLLAQLGRPREALEVVERARARAFLDLLATRDLRLASPSPTTTIESARRVPLASSTTASASAIPMRGASPPTTRGGDFQRMESLVAAEPPTVDGMVALAGRLGSTILTYWVDESRSFVWVVAPDGTVTFREIAAGARVLSRLVRATWALPAPGTRRAGASLPEGASLGDDPDDAATWTPLTRGGGRLTIDPASREAGRKLYDLLIAPVRTALPSSPRSLVTVVPHGPLCRLAFAGLAAPSGRYVLEDLRLHYAPSIGTLASMAARSAPVPVTGRVVVVADPQPLPRVDGDDLSRLPGAASEGRAVARAVGADRAVLLAGPVASEARVRQELTSARVVHFATHGVVRDDAPFDSYLALGALASGSPGDDGRLTAGEVYGLSLEADLVVLSACRSASGPVTGDGIIGLTRAFFYAGTPSIVASLWDLPDEAGRIAIPRFYRAWRETGDKAEALRRAQLALLRELRAGRVAADTPAGRFALPEHPALWAGLVLIGQP